VTAAAPALAPPGPGAAVEVAEGVLWARLPLPMTLDHVNVYALDDGDGWTIVDAGLATDGCRAGWDALLAGALAGRPVRRIVVTHHHPDHVGLAARFVRAGAELWTTRTAWLYARMLTLDHQDRPTPEALAFLRRAGWRADWLDAHAAREPYNFSRRVEPLPLGFRRIADGDLVAMGGRRWRVVTGGGHAPEHATFWSEDGALALTGDQVLPRISPNVGVYATEPDADPLADWFGSCRRLAAIATPDRLALPGHDAPFTGLPARLGQLIERHEAALARVLALAAHRPATAVDAFAALYRRVIGADDRGLATAEAVAHVNHLAARGALVAREDVDGARRFGPA
jgi:glyoxylase-like metal-dependent hydrolase (beta-lactamase superfamily II)